MRKLVAIVSISALVLGLAAAPALAGKKKKTVTEEWQAVAAPGPFDPTAGAGACPENAIEGVQRVTHVFTTPGNGSMDISMTNFQGDWDLYAVDSDGNTLGQSTGFVEATTERIILTLKKGQEIGIMACNFIGTPTADLSLTYTYK